jgi:hypothetical protein
MDPFVRCTVAQSICVDLYGSVWARALLLWLYSRTMCITQAGAGTAGAWLNALSHGLLLCAARLIARGTCRTLRTGPAPNCLLGFLSSSPFKLVLIEMQ